MEWVLSSGEHPNHAGKSNEIKPEKDDWITLINKIKIVVNNNL